MNLRPIRTTGWNPATNFEGIAYFGGEWAPSEDSYTQLFRKGGAEAASHGLREAMISLRPDEKLGA